MLGVLLESKARRQRRSGGVALSVAVHLALITAATVATATGAGRPKKPDPPVVVRFTPPAPVPETPRQARVITDPQPSLRQPSITITRIPVPTFIPTELPPITPSTGASLDSLIIGSGPPGATGGRPGGLDLTERPGNSEWRGSELMMRITSSAKPRYPEPLRQAGIDGRVLIRFTVDTLGRIDPASVTIVQSTHDLFTRSVRDILGSFRFKPAEADGHRVPAMAEMPFEFAIRK